MSFAASNAPHSCFCSVLSSFLHLFIVQNEDLKCFTLIFRCPQVATLKDQLAQEVKKRNQYLSRSARASTDVNEIRALLDSSLANVARDPSLDAALLEAETRRLDDALDLKCAPTRLSPAPRARSPVRTSSPTRGTPLGVRRSPLALYNGGRKSLKK